MVRAHLAKSSSRLSARLISRSRSYTRAAEMAVHESTTTTTATPRARSDGAFLATRGAQRATLLGALFLLGLLSLGRLLLTAFSYGIPAWFDEEMNPLI